MRSAAGIPWERTASSVALRTAVCVLAVAIAFHWSLLSLLRLASYDTPLAYLGLVPVLVLCVSLGRARVVAEGELRLPDRQVDWMIGLPMLAAALAIAVVLPERLSFSVWTLRLDLLGLPLFAAGAVAIVFGGRVLRRLRTVLLLLLLSWPLPYERFLQPALEIGAEASVAVVAGLAEAVPGVTRTSGSLFALAGPDGAFVVNLAPVCAGVNTGVGFVLVGGALLLTQHGSRWAKGAWLLLGVSLVLLLNVGRLLLIFGAGAAYGERVALDWLHPYVGLVLFACGCAVMYVLAPRFGLSTSASARQTGPRSQAQDAPGQALRARRLTIPAIVVVCAASLTMGWANQSLARYAPFGPVAVSPTLPPLTGQVPVLPGWRSEEYDSVPWAARYFGRDASWHRYRYTPEPGTGRSLAYLDVVSTRDLQAFSVFSLEKCYRFHAHRLHSIRDVEIGSPAGGQVLRFTDHKRRQAWTAVSWILPVHDDGRRYERAVLLLPGVGADREHSQRIEQAAITMARAINARHLSGPALALEKRS